MEENKQKITFLKRIKIAIFKLEDYGFFLGERFKVALKYFFLLVFLLSIVMSILDTHTLNKMINKASNYIETELPEFTYEDGYINFSEKVDAYDHEYGFKLLINTNKDVTEEQVKEYKVQLYNEPIGMLILSDKFVYAANGAEAEYNYEEFFNMSGLQITNKQELKETISQIAIPAIVTTFFVTDLIIIYISNILTILGDVFVIAIFGLIAARFCGLRFKMYPMLSLAIYSLTLSIVLTAIYSVIYGLTGFVINYFNVMYLLIAYVYIIAAILMIKYDLIKQHFELEKILEVQKQVHEELKEEKEDKEDKEDKSKEKEEDKNEEKNDESDVNNREPDGSEI